MSNHISLVSKSGTDTVELMSSIKVPDKFFSRIDLGVSILNEIFGGQEMPGIMKGTSFLFTGMPGAGKSTMALQLADLLQHNGNQNVLYNIGEENKYMIKLRADRIGITGGFKIGCIEQVDELLNFCKENKIEVLIQDSLQTLCDEDLEGARLLKQVTKKLHSFAKAHDMTVIAIGHITKGGMFAGPNTIKHDVDAHMHLSLNNDTGNRVLEFQKNRFGPACIPYEFIISSKGLDFQHVQIEKENVTVANDNEYQEQSNKQINKRDKIKNLIKEKLLAGEKISGYCFERFEADCSGGFRRSMLSAVCKELQIEGHFVEDKKINGRSHNFLKV